jgi:anti-sigma-K factor RskA
MRPDNPELVDRLAAEYALGTLRGRARERFERWRASSPLADERTRVWEDRLVELASGVRPVEPPQHVWTGIRKRLKLAPGGRGWNRPLALAAGIAAVLLIGALLYFRSFELTRPTAYATISVVGPPAWQVVVFGRVGRLEVRTGNAPAPAPGRAYELWALLPNGAPPVSLGVLPGSGTVQHDLSAAQKQALQRATQVAVSVEPLGGSPTGQPTGTIIFVVPLKTLVG